MLDEIYNKSLDNEITKEDSLDLINSANQFELYDTADQLRQRIVGDKVTYVVNKAIDITDHCMIGCKFCSFRDNEQYHMTNEEISDSIVQAKSVGATEICLFGGITKDMDINYYCDLIKTIKDEHDICLHALSPAEVYQTAINSGISTYDALTQLKEAGMDTMTGASAEILVDSIRQQICPNKLTTSQWAQVVKEAHELGIPTTSTIMYGSIETWEDRIEHLFLLKEIQEETHGFTEFVPMTFLGGNNELGKISNGATGVEDLKLHAISRIIFSDVIPNIQVSWVKLGLRMTQVALTCGANDIGGTMIEDKISTAAGGGFGGYLPVEKIHELIEDIGRIPQERTTKYEMI
ncbi:5-amino-6-(D-ribitylamino)uracil--L-tyrosine 4-hydroxyphenyl transferase CofH [Methanosphaera cuniculi]|uniref:5-amino-6-(D-ribitylamino)uracil--L-tyrosine 4-hydroxyphenyl transferase n=1 Tax=Methanosphaera cuniculi TaxID=1077256 RepID=A0A2A2HEX0_9EURY|nr:5-amino-6-(D-ribitylamino)uracil--L-tyrosine 4-hydroxyphenyl transferase CofH [Methanosphaera cuniculi]PAV07866.1 FO synthase subunit 2 [Methanosphaera cuniculi]PWL07682.1 cyclic dehypoxanthine futalosine synthase [Methanosphaera cuniculi]